MNNGIWLYSYRLLSTFAVLLEWSVCHEAMWCWLELVVVVSNLLQGRSFCDIPFWLHNPTLFLFLSVSYVNDTFNVLVRHTSHGRSCLTRFTWSNAALVMLLYRTATTATQFRALHSQWFFLNQGLCDILEVLWFSSEHLYAKDSSKLQIWWSSAWVVQHLARLEELWDLVRWWWLVNLQDRTSSSVAKKK